MPNCAVFISSTSEDLKEYRAAAKEAVLAVGLRPVMMEYFSASGGGPLPECLARLTPCAVVVVVAAQRYGWVPPDQRGSRTKSITWLECEHALGHGKELLVFVPDDAVCWPDERTESYRLKAAFDSGAFTQDLPAEIARNVSKLAEFRAWLENGRTRRTFTTADDLKSRVMQALYEWLDDHSECRPELKPKDPRRYLEWLRAQTAIVEIRGLGERVGKARSFPMEELYIPLTTSSDESPRRSSAERKPLRLEEALSHRQLVIAGDPGSGKTTFLRHLANAIVSRSGQEIVAQSHWPTSLAHNQPFPIFIRIPDLIAHTIDCTNNGDPRTCPEPKSPQWLSHFLHVQNTKLGWGLSGEFFEEKMRSGDAVVLLDGLDEAPNRAERERAARLFEAATHRFDRSRFVVTTRSQSYEGGAVLSGFHEVRIEPLTHEAIATFLKRWCRGLYTDSPAKADEHCQELTEALRLKPEIRHLARNPVMLTALAVVHWNERRLPEQRAELYEAILKWLSRQRDTRAGRELPDRCLSVLAELALAMQNHRQGRRVRVSLKDGSHVIARDFGASSPEERIRKATEFLEQETGDSGIIVSRSGDLQFWHLTFQEYLAALAIAGRVEQEQASLLLDPGKLYSLEWREVMLLLVGILHGQGKKKVDGLITSVLKRTGPAIGDRIRAAGLLGAMVNDLRPLAYSPADPRYNELMDSALAVFDRGKAKGIAFETRLEAAEALGQAGDPRLSGNQWVRIQGGTLPMGDATGCLIMVRGFEIGRYPVTVQEYLRFVDDDGYTNDEWWAAGSPKERKPLPDWEEQQSHPNRPVTAVTWFEAAAYSKWVGARLITEVEWEFAARGPDGREYAWGDQSPNETHANNRETGPQHPTPVGLYPAGGTPDGVLDMTGNVWEWLDSSHDNEHNYRSLRGGSWGSDPEILRAAERVGGGPNDRSNDIGFRLARKVFAS